MAEPPNPSDHPRRSEAPMRFDGHDQPRGDETAGGRNGAACAPICARRATGCCGPRPSWKTTASGPAASWKKSAATPICRCCAICCRCVDNIQRAIAAAEKSPDGGGLARRHPHGGPAAWSGTLARHHCTRIDALHKPFDPAVHEAIAQQPSDQFPPHTVVAVAQDGYMLHDRVVRPAQVVVSTLPTGTVAAILTAASRTNDSTAPMLPDSRTPQTANRALHADLRLPVRCLRTQVRAFSVDQRQAAQEVPQVQKIEAAATVRHRRGDRLQGIGLLSNRLSQRLLQKSRQADKASGDKASGEGKSETKSGETKSNEGKSTSGDKSSGSSSKGDSKSGGSSSRGGGKSGGSKSSD